MKNRITIVALIMGAVVFSYQRLNAQDATFTQVYANPLLLNPAIMGASNDITAGLSYRNQWGSISNGYSDYSFNGMYPIHFGSDNKGKLDAGLSVMEDKAGAFTQLSALLAVDYTREIAEDQHLCAALLGGYGQYAVSTSGLTFDDQYVMGGYNSSNPSSETMLSQKKGYADVGFGFTWVMNPSRDKSKINAYLGIAGFHMNEPNTSFTGSVSRLPIRMSYLAGIKIFESDKIDITPNAIVNTQNGNIESAIGTYVDYIFNENLKLTLGVWYRRNDAIAILVGCEFKGFSLGYSYDADISTVSNFATGINANEITLSYRLGKHSGGGSKASFTDSSGSTLGGSAGKGAGASSDDSNPSPFPHY